MEYFVIYLLVMADRIVATASSLKIFGLLSVLSIIAFAISKVVSDVAVRDSLRSILKPVIVVSTFIWFSASFVSATFPNTKQLAAIIGTSFAYNAVSSESGKAMAKEAYEIVQLHMHNYTDELRKGLEGRRTELKKELIETIIDVTPTTEGE